MPGIPGLTIHAGNLRRICRVAAEFTQICIYIYISKVPALHGFASRVVFCTAWHCKWQAKNSHCTELPGPAGKATMHGFARNTRKWIGNFTNLHGTAWQIPVHMYPNLALLMKLEP